MKHLSDLNIGGIECFSFRKVLPAVPFKGGFAKQNAQVPYVLSCGVI